MLAPTKSFIYTSQTLPPSCNDTYKVNYRTKKIYVTPKAHQFRSIMREHWIQQKIKPFVGDVSIVIKMCSKNKHVRDLDNTFKPVLDAMQKGGVFPNDSQVCRILGTKCRCQKCPFRFTCTVKDLEVVFL